MIRSKSDLTIDAPSEQIDGEIWNQYIEELQTDRHLHQEDISNSQSRNLRNI